MGLLALKADCADAELLRLRTQIEPHFLFNTMATIVQMYQDRQGCRRSHLGPADRLHERSARPHAAPGSVLGDELALTEGLPRNPAPADGRALALRDRGIP
jgi:hypothetical protein